jgi:hypothetical protein
MPPIACAYDLVDEDVFPPIRRIAKYQVVQDQSAGAGNAFLQPASGWPNRERPSRRIQSCTPPKAKHSGHSVMTITE